MEVIDVTPNFVCCYENLHAERTLIAPKALCSSYHNATVHVIIVIAIQASCDRCSIKNVFNLIFVCRCWDQLTTRRCRHAPETNKVTQASRNYTLHQHFTQKRIRCNCCESLRHRLITRFYSSESWWCLHVPWVVPNRVREMTIHHYECVNRR